jgi:hypothetical protein
MKVLKSFFSIVFFIALASFGFAQQKLSLLVAEYDEHTDESNLQYLMKYVFMDGVMTSKEQIIAAPIQHDEQKANYVRFDIGENKIYRNRYLITGVGNIIDIKNKKTLLEEQALFVAFNGDSVIFHTDDIFKGNYYSIYNLKTEKYYKVEDANYHPYPVPDVEFDVSVTPFVINYYDIKGKKTVLVNDAGYGEALPINGDKVKRKNSLFWTDKNHFLYAYFAKDQKSLSIYKVGIDRSIEKIAVIDSILPTVVNTFFEYDAVGNTVYSFSKGRFVIDINKQSAGKIIFENVGNGFFIESAENTNYGRKIKLNNTEIGTKWCRFDNAKTTKDYIAIENNIVAGSERYFQGVAVWNTGTKKWTTLKVFELVNIIGWVNE